MNTSPSKLSWCVEPGSHRWLAARVAWEFGTKMYCGTCIGWTRDPDSRRLAFFVLYDDDDKDVFELTEMKQAIRQYQTLDKARRLASSTLSSALSFPAAPQATPRRRAAAWEPTSANRIRKPVDPDQGLFPFPIVISPRRLLSKSSPSACAQISETDGLTNETIVASEIQRSLECSGSNEGGHGGVS
eukprot:CAMPEP_0119331592 /NCGR_PEP_ID=MMETSP1333-20130426/80905_1 /TAXON_ID=418940 /ORGANISM="Scyphosphaera apsteinii, Strain RCC1455" /LENGTH=186 /DNA_ID=CAMNT_0007341229 /DNA_START=34 /DNA_END=591 /DNA_ORIENTATION=+